MPGGGRRAGLRPAERTGLPGVDRGLQRTLAAEAVGPLLGSRPDRAAGAFRRLRRGEPPPGRCSDRARPSPIILPDRPGDRSRRTALCAHRGSRRRRELGKAECPPNGIRAAGPPAHLVTNGPALSRSTM